MTSSYAELVLMEYSGRPILLDSNLLLASGCTAKYDALSPARSFKRLQHVYSKCNAVLLLLG